MLLQECFGRSDVWCNIDVMRTFTHQDWLENFRMCKEIFLYICNKLSSALGKTDTVLRPLSVERRVAVALWCLATPTEYRTIAHLFGIARSTVCEIVHNTCQCILDVFMKDYIQFPTGDKLNKVVALWCLATPIEYRTIAHLFGIAHSTVCEIVHNTCQCILDVFMKDYIQFPTGDKLNKVVDEFKSK